MGITPDGDRSKKWLWLARKKLAQLRESGNLAQALKANGFTISVKDNDGLDGGRITAPMGMVVLASNADGVRVMVADNWQGGFDSRQDYNILFRDPPVFGLYTRVGTKDTTLVADGETTVKFDPAPSQSPFGTVNEVFVPGAYWENDAHPEPVVMPFKGGEAFFVGADVLITAEDEIVFEWLLNWYTSNGSSLTSRTYGHFETQLATLPPWYMFQSIPATHFAVVGFQYFLSYGVSGGKPYAAMYFWYGTDNVSYTDKFYNEDLFVDLPAGLRTILLTDGNNSAEKPLGSYAWALTQDAEPTLLHACDDTNTGIPVASPPEEAWYTANPGEVRWKLFYTIKTRAGALATVNSDGFVAALNVIDAGVGNPIADWNAARRAFYQLFGRPNNNGQVPHDTTMFHADDGNVYVYTRKYGNFKFTPTGITAAVFTVPVEVAATAGVRPTITYAGAGLYLCVCENFVAPREVVKIYYGSPFDTWTALPDPASGYHLTYVRPVKVAAGEIILLGILVDETTPGYRVAFLRYTGTEEWSIMTKVPVTADDDLVWDIGLFGDGRLVKDLNDYLDPPDVMPQMPVCSTYSDYDQP